MRDQSKKAMCAFYAIDDYGLAVPTKFTRIIWTDQYVNDLMVQLSHSDSVGEKILYALDLSFGRKSPIGMPSDIKSATIFEEKMDQFRVNTGVGKKRFDRTLSLITIQRTSGDILFAQNQQVHGRFAFECNIRIEDRPSLKLSSSKEEIGALVRKMLSL